MFNTDINENTFYQFITENETSLFCYILASSCYKTTKTLFSKNRFLYSDFLIYYQRFGIDTPYFDIFKKLSDFTCETTVEFQAAIDKVYFRFREDDAIYNNTITIFDSLTKFDYRQLEYIFDNIQSKIIDHNIKFVSQRHVNRPDEMSQEEFFSKIDSYRSVRMLKDFLSPKNFKEFDFDTIDASYIKKSVSDNIKLPEELDWLASSFPGRGIPRGTLFSVLGKPGRGKTMWIQNLVSGLVRPDTGNGDLKVHHTFIGDMKKENSFLRYIGMNVNEAAETILDPKHTDRCIQLAKEVNPNLFNKNIVYSHSMEPGTFTAEDYWNYLVNTDFKDSGKKIIDYFDVFVIDHEGNIPIGHNGPFGDKGLDSHVGGGEKFNIFKRIANYETDGKAKLAIVAVQPKTTTSGSLLDGIKELAMEDISESSQKQRVLDVLIAVNVLEDSNTPNYIGSITVLKSRDGAYRRQLYLKDLSGVYIYVDKSTFKLLADANREQNMITYTSIKRLFKPIIPDSTKYGVYKDIDSLGGQIPPRYHKFKTIDGDDPSYFNCSFDSNNNNNISNNEVKTVIQKNEIKRNLDLYISENGRLLDKNQPDGKATITVSFLNERDLLEHKDLVEKLNYLIYKEELPTDEKVFEDIKNGVSYPSWFKFVPDSLINSQFISINPKKDCTDLNQLKLAYNNGILHLKKKLGLPIKCTSSHIVDALDECVDNEVVEQIETVQEISSDLPTNVEESVTNNNDSIITATTVITNTDNNTSGILYEPTVEESKPLLKDECKCCSGIFSVDKPFVEYDFTEANRQELLSKEFVIEEKVIEVDPNDPFNHFMDKGKSTHDWIYEMDFGIPKVVSQIKEKGIKNFIPTNTTDMETGDLKDTVVIVNEFLDKFVDKADIFVNPNLVIMNNDIIDISKPYDNLDRKNIFPKWKPMTKNNHSKEDSDNTKFLNIYPTMEDNIMLDRFRYKNYYPEWFKFIPEEYVNSQGIKFYPMRRMCGLSWVQLKFLANKSIQVYKRLFIENYEEKNKLF